MATVASASQRLLTALPGNMTASSLKWALGGWSLFIAENAILSENRAVIIDSLDDEKYHIVYGTCSTIATASIVYSYRKLLQLQYLAPTAVRPISLARLGFAGLAMSAGLIMASQTAPTLQIPIELSGEIPTRDVKTEPTDDLSQTPKSWNLKVRCPFDFSDRKRNTDESSPTGMERISRHPALWAFGLTAAGNAALQPTPALALWMLGPVVTAWLGGSHTDSRYRRGIGGTLDPLYDAQTSNIPFAALITGRQASDSLRVWLTEEFKPLNAAVAVSIACVWVASRGRMSRRLGHQLTQ